ncbi:MAG: right-handed parallel beta-helix repeat-containing protein, partial [Planctomycetota bacterium]
GNHIITNCIVRDCSLTGGNASGGNAGGEEYQLGGNGGNGGSAGGAGIYISDIYDYEWVYDPNDPWGFGTYTLISWGSSPTIKNCRIENCSVNGGNGADGGVGGEWARGGSGGLAGEALGAGIFCSVGTKPIFIDCNVINCQATAGNGGNGGDGGEYGAGGWGGLCYEDPNQGDPRKVSARGGGVYCAGMTEPNFINCTFRGNVTDGSVSGLGGFSWGGYQEQPRNNYNIASLGAGVYCGSGCSATFKDCTIQDNQTTYYESYPTGYGGGICLEGSETSVDPSYIYDYGYGYGYGYGYDYGYYDYYDFGPISAEITNCNFTGNSAAIGGGIYWTTSDVNTVDCLFVDNSSYVGAGLFSLDSAADIAGCTFRGNMASGEATPEPEVDPNDPNDPNQDQEPDVVYGSGGGLYIFTTDANIVDCVITENTATGSGGGIYLGGHPQSTIPLGFMALPELKNCLVTSNTAGREGGGVSCNRLVEATISNCTIADNRLTQIPSYGGGLYCTYASTAEVIDSIIWGNTSTDGSQVAVEDNLFYLSPPTVTITHSDIQVYQDPNVALSALDIVFCIDTTNSMSFVIDALKNSMTEIINQVGESTTDFRIGVVEYRDYPLPPDNDPNPATDPNLWFIYRDVSPFTSDVDALVTDINNIIAEDGHDNSAVYMALMHCIDAESLEALLDANGHSDWVPADSPGPGEWRSGGSVAKMIILMGDLGPTDPEPHSGYTLDDIVTAANAESIQIFSIVAGYGGYSLGLPIVEAFGDLAEGTGGIMFDAAAEPSEVVNAVMDAIQLVTRVSSPIYVERGCTLYGWEPNDPNDFWTWDVNSWNPDTNNIDADPCFVAGYYLSWWDAGQDMDSPCVDMGSAPADDPNIGLHTYTTRTDGINDVNTVDMGYHYSEGIAQYELTIVFDVIIDNGDDGTSYTGYWGVSNNLTCYGENSLWCTDVNGTYSFEAWVTGIREVSLWWTANSNRSDAASVEIYDGDTLIDTVAVNQQINGGQWNRLGSYAFTEKAKVKIISDGSAFVIADAVKLGICGTVAPSQPRPVDYNSVTNTYTFYADTQVTLVADPCEGYRVKAWSGTENEPAWDTNENTVTMTEDKTVTIQFEQIPLYQLYLVVGDNGALEIASPNWIDYNSVTGAYTYFEGTVVTLIALPDPNYRVKAWTGTDDNLSVEPNNTVTMDESKIVTVEFELPRILSVPISYSSIQEAFDEAREGDEILVAPGTYVTSTGYLIYDKDVTISGINPDDPCVVAQTVVQLDVGEGGGAGRGFTFMNVGPKTVLSGLTIKGFNYRGLHGDEYTLGDDPNISSGKNGIPVAGGGIICAMASPTIKNCIITDCNIIGGNGIDGEAGDAEDPNGGHGGWPGFAYGGGMACLFDSHPA